MLHKYKSQLLLICGLAVSLALFTACSSQKAAPASAAVVSSSLVGDNTSGTSSEVAESASSLQVSSLVSSSAPQVSSAVTASSPSSIASHQAPVTSKPSSQSSGTTTGSAKTTAPASKPASKPVPAVPASKPVSTAPAETGVSAKYHGATYGCSDKSQYDLVLEKAAAVKESSAYDSAMSKIKQFQSSFEDLNGVPYSDSWADVIAIRAYFGASGTGSGSTGSAYDYFTGTNRMCADKAKALEASLHCAGYNARLAAGTRAGDPHMWCQIYMDGEWYNLTEHISTVIPSGYTLSSTGYNL